MAKDVIGKSWQRRRLEAYMAFPDHKVREAVYSLAKSLQAQGTSIPQALQGFVDHCDAVRREVPKPDAVGGKAK